MQDLAGAAVGSPGCAIRVDCDRFVIVVPLVRPASAVSASESPASGLGGAPDTLALGRLQVNSASCMQRRSDRRAGGALPLRHGLWPRASSLVAPRVLVDTGSGDANLEFTGGTIDDL